MDYCNFLDLTSCLASLKAQNKKAYLIYLESPYLLKFDLNNFLQLPNCKMFRFSNCAIHSITDNPQDLQKIVENSFRPIGNRKSYNILAAPLNEFPEQPSKIFYEIFKKLRYKKRFLHLPNFANYKRLSEIICRGDSEICLDLPEDLYISVETLSILSNKNVKLKKDENYVYIIAKDEDHVKITKVIKAPAHQNSTIVIDHISLEESHKVIQSFLITTNYDKKILEFASKISGNSYSRLISFLEESLTQECITWDPFEGWQLRTERQKTPLTISAQDYEKILENLDSKAIVVYYIISHSSELIDKNDLLMVIPALKKEELERILEVLTERKLIKVSGKNIIKISSLNNTTVKNPKIKKELTKICYSFATLLKTKKMNGSYIDDLEIAKFYELSGEKRRAMKTYLEAAENFNKLGMMDKAINSMQKAIDLCNYKSKVNYLKKDLIHLYIKSGDYWKAYKILQELKNKKLPESLEREIIRLEIMLHFRLGEHKKSKELINSYHLNSAFKKNKELLFYHLMNKLYLDEFSLKDYSMTKKIAAKLLNTNEKAKYYILLGDIEIYRNNIKQAIENYIKALKLIENSDEKLVAEIKLSEALLINLRFLAALDHIENILWNQVEIKNKAILEYVLGELGKIYLYLFQTEFQKKFIILSIDKILANNPKPLYPINALIGMHFLRSGRYEEGKSILIFEIKKLRKEGNHLEANFLTLKLAKNAIKHGHWDDAKKFLHTVKTKSEFVFTRKRFLEKLLDNLENNFNWQEVIQMGRENSINMLDFIEITRNVNNEEVDLAKETFIKKLEQLKELLSSRDFGNFEIE